MPRATRATGRERQPARRATRGRREQQLADPSNAAARRCRAPPGASNSPRVEQRAVAESLAMMARDPIPDRYELAMHYVGSVIERHGVEKFKTLMRRLPYDSGTEEFAAAHADIYGESLADALAGMDVPVLSRLRPRCDGEPLAWGDGADLEVTARGTCGDGRLYGSGFVPGYPAFYKQFTVDVPAGGIYNMSVTSLDGDPLTTGMMLNCPGVKGDVIGARDGETSAGILNPGLHSLRIGFPMAPEARGEVVVRLQYQGDPNAAHADDGPTRRAPD